MPEPSKLQNLFFVSEVIKSAKTGEKGNCNQNEDKENRQLNSAISHHDSITSTLDLLLNSGVDFSSLSLSDQWDLAVRFAVHSTPNSPGSEPPDLAKVKLFLDELRYVEKRRARIRAEIKHDRQYEENRQMISYLYNKVKAAEEKEEARRFARLKRQNRERREATDVLSYPEFKHLVKKFPDLQKKSFVCYRTKLAIILQCMTGLRISNLLPLTQRHVKSLFNTGQVTLQIIKNGPQYHEIRLTKNNHAFLKEHAYLFDRLKHGKALSDFVFTGEGKTSALNVNQFTREVNKLLHSYGVSINKNLKSHALRHTYITLFSAKMKIQDLV